MFDSLGEKFEGAFRKLRGKKTLSEENIKEAMREVRLALLEADVNYQVVKDFVARVREAALGEEVIKGVNPAQMFVSIVHRELVRMMSGFEDAEQAPKGFVATPGQRQVILLLGLQGAGKTTFCGKLANHLRRKHGCKPLMVACDVHRPAAVEQLKSIGASLSIPVFERGTGAPVQDIVRGALAQAEASGNDVVLVDTAGRLHIDDVKMDELKAIRGVVEPDYSFLVADAMTGQDAVNSAAAFNEQIGIDGVCLTKMDGDARGGAALSIRAVTGKPVVFTGVGEKPDDLEEFRPDGAARRILGMGDVVSLVEKAQEAIDEGEAEDLREKLGSGNFSYDDFIKQMKMVRRMGSIKGLLGLLPGVGSMMRGLDNEVMDKELRRVESMICSMTKQERREPDLVRESGHRRQRIAKGSGHTLRQVNELVRQFEQMREMMRGMAGSGLFGGMKEMMAGGADPSAILGAGGGMPPGMPGMPGLPPGMEMPTSPEDMPAPGTPEFKKLQKQWKQLKQAQKANRPKLGTALSKNQQKRQRRKSRR